MKKVLLFVLPPVLACVVFFSAMFVISNSDKGKGALQVTATPKSDVYLDGKLIGETPFCKCNLPDLIPTGNYTVRLVPENSTIPQFEQQISINKSVISVVDVNFADNNGTSASIISLNPLQDSSATQIFATSFPDNAKIALDKNPSGQTPVLIKDVTDSDHDLLFDKDGYQSQVLHVHTVKGYKLSAIAFLAIKANLETTASSSGSQTPSPMGNPSETPTPTQLQATPSTKVTPASKTTPTPTKSAITGPQVLILDTPTGSLHVRATASAYGTIVGQVNPGETFPLVDEQSGWYEITLSDGTKGWISSQYAKKE
jgi:hypothetical protein